MRIESKSSLDTFKQCKKKYWFHYLSNLKKDASSKALVRGRNIHESIENKDRIKKEVEKAFKLIGGRGKRVKGSKYPFLVESDNLFMEQAETGFGLSKAMKLVDFLDQEAIFRGKIDLIRYFINRDKLKSVSCLEEAIERVLLVDWKTGEKAKNEHIQLRYYSLYVFLSIENIQTIECRNVFIDKDEQPKPFTVERKEMLDIFEEILSRINEVNQAQDFPTCPTPLCNWCQYQDICQGKNDLADLIVDGKLNLFQ